MRKTLFACLVLSLLGVTPGASYGAYSVPSNLACAAFSTDILLKYQFMASQGVAPVQMDPQKIANLEELASKVMASLTLNQDVESFRQSLEAEVRPSLAQVRDLPRQGVVDAFIDCVAKLAFYAQYIPQNTPNLSADKQSALKSFLASQFLRQQAKKDTGSQFESVTGSGFFISEQGHLLTNNHVVSGRSVVSILHPRMSTPISAQVLATDPDNDLALLKIEYQTKPLHLSSSAVGAGQPILAAGFPKISSTGFSHKYTSGYVLSASGVLSEPERLTFSASVDHGSSGGPLVDNGGNLVGVVFGMFQLPSSQKPPLGIAVQTEVARRFLAANRVPYQDAIPGGPRRDLDESVVLILARVAK